MPSHLSNHSDNPSFGREGREMQTFPCFFWGRDLSSVIEELVGPQGI